MGQQIKTEVIPVHPRERGEHPATAPTTQAMIGSSPRARGTRHDATRRPRWVWFIPASAGNTQHPARLPGGDPVHPRERGEHCTPWTWSRMRSGSSPRARGTQHGGSPRRWIKRFIPASAGNTPPPTPRVFESSVHPRERGEHARLGPIGPVQVGSSPRARGTPHRYRLAARLHRFIPASAGNTPAAAAPGARPTVHPRERGEHHAGVEVGAIPGGSSPRARGTPGTMTAWGRMERFIPASAGNTAHTLIISFSMTVHPRERGEHAQISWSSS